MSGRGLRSSRGVKACTGPGSRQNMLPRDAASVCPFEPRTNTQPPELDLHKSSASVDFPVPHYNIHQHKEGKRGGEGAGRGEGRGGRGEGGGGREGGGGGESELTSPVMTTYESSRALCTMAARRARSSSVGIIAFTRQNK